MFKVGDKVVIPSHVDKRLHDHIHYSYIETVLTVQTVNSTSENLLNIRLSEANWWVNEEALVHAKDYKIKTPIERKIAHLEKIYKER